MQIKKPRSCRYTEDVHLQAGTFTVLCRLFLLAEFVAALTLGGVGKRFTFDRSDDHMTMNKNHVGQAAAKRSDQRPEQEFADLHPGLF